MTPAQKFRKEFIQLSGISPELFDVAITVASDIELLPTGDVCSPLHDALGWNYVRFGHQVKASQVGAILTQEDGSPWQVKLENPRKDSKQKSIKYETPKGAGSRAYLPEVPALVRQKIGERYGVSVPIFGSFWRWLELHPEIPILWTEGGKKSLCLLSHGFVAIALNGVNGGYRKQVDGSRVLTPDVLRFAQAGRVHYLAFDRDIEPKTQHRVTVAIMSFGALLQQSGSVKVTSWDSELGKGVDDLIVGAGVASFERSYAESLPLLDFGILGKLSRKLNVKPDVKLVSADLSKLEISNLPDTGIIALLSAKGTGKTKFISSLVRDFESVLSATHRVALGRNLCNRLGLNWRGDIDKAGGRFINSSGYTLRVGFCVDSLLAINPESFAGCDLVLDEVCQVVRHLITSSTCAKDGKRPALLARFRELVQVARRVIVADADLDNATLAYLQELRDSEDREVKESVFLIRNDYQSLGYRVRFIESPDRTPITAEILEAVASAPKGQVVFIATDSKGMSKAFGSLIEKQYPDKKILVINSETSGGDIEREVMQSPDRSLYEGMFDVVIASPSMATGVSIEAQGIIFKVFGVFTGASSTDADMAQALGRVREPVDRVVWCARVGSNYSRVSRSTNQREIRDYLQQSTAATVRLIRSNLREDVVGEIEKINWNSNPHLDMFCQLSAEQNYSMQNLRDALRLRLQFEGNTVEVVQEVTNPAVKFLLKEVREAQKIFEAEELVSADDLDYRDVLALEQKEVITPEEHRALAKHYFKEFYALENVTIDDVLWDNQGRRRSELLALEVQVNRELGAERTVKALEKQASWNKGICVWDAPTIELKRALRELLGINELIEKMAQGWEWTKHDLKPYADKARGLQEQVKAVLAFSITEKVADTQIIHQLLAELGVKVHRCRWSRTVEGYETKKLRVYSLDVQQWQMVQEVLHRRKLKREWISSGSPPPQEEINIGGDPNGELLTAYAELLLEASQYGQEALWELYRDIPEGIKDEVLGRVPEPLVESVLREQASLFV